MDKLSQIALSLIPKLGPTSCRRLLDAYPGEDIFALPPSELKIAFGRHLSIIQAILDKSTHAAAEQQLRHAEQHGIRILFLTDPDYPARLNRPETQDCPVLLYVLGHADLNTKRSIAVVGTRNSTSYGREATAMLVRQLQPCQPTIVSGLAYGIDTAAHTAALEQDLPTRAVLGHGLDRIYPSQNRGLAAKIIERGGALVTEYTIGTDISPRLFPARNRIIAALSDATLVTEASEKGGALITAAIAATYQRDVFALPGRVTDTYSRGTNNLITTNRAVLARSADDIAANLGWPLQSTKNETKTAELLPSLSPTEQRIVDLLHAHSQLTLNEIATLSGMPLTKAASIIFTLEAQKAIHALPGRLYEAV